ncbi:uncharacterized protein [Halyomorpha halys]|uniref:uncharacterized protein n=1 Tax=Halyomorpha halys TaxID=286706 RepID=UPI0006D504FB|nr:mannose-6-phosphate isomerase-like [Halyomorpha halys]XP_014284724.1 mannose-6-phosphate isomerase-like [Halyomorpha halys]
MELIGHLQTYEWGKYGKESVVAWLYCSSINCRIDSETPYAELWIGVHKNGQSRIKDCLHPLSEFLSKNTHIIGGLTSEMWCLPFIFKIVSVNKPLPIQVHPSKVQALDLRKRMPRIYKDVNHKPKMIIALNDFQLLCAFRPLRQIRRFLREVPELEMIIPKELIRKYLIKPRKEWFIQILLNVLSREEDVMEATIERFLQRLENESEDKKNRYLYNLIKKFSECCPNDVGVFMCYFLNYFTIERGEWVYIPPGIPHSYIEGDCIECSACSDNVIRCGLTPKFKDIDVFLEIVDFKSYQIDRLVMEAVPRTSGTVLVYNPPLYEFGVTKIIIENGETFQTPLYEAFCTFIVMSGEGEVGEDNGKRAIKMGSIFFLFANERYLIRCTKGSTMVLYFAYPNTRQYFQSTSNMVD